MLLVGGLNVLAGLSPAARYNLGLFLLVAALGAACVWGYRLWSEFNEDLEPASPDELLASFRQARAEGEIDEEEYSRLRARIEESDRDRPEGEGRG